MPDKVGSVSPGSEHYSFRTNWRFILISSGCALAFLAASAIWVRYQSVRNARFHRERAAELADSGEWSRAARMLHNYLKVQPDDVAARIELAWAFDNSAESKLQPKRAADLFERALAVEPGDTSMKLRHAELLLLDRPKTAIQEARAAAQHESASSEDVDRALRIEALASLALSRLPAGDVSHSQALRTLRDAVERNRDDIDLAATLAGEYLSPRCVLPENKKSDEALRIVDATVEANPQSAMAFLLRYRFRERFPPQESEPEDSPENDLNRAFELDGENLEVLLAMGELEQRNARTPEALEQYNRAVELHPHDYRGYLMAGTLLLTEGRVDEAVTVWKQGVLKMPYNEPRLHSQLVTAYLALGELDKAKTHLTALDRSVLRMPDEQARLARATTTYYRAKIAANENRLASAIRFLKRIKQMQVAAATRGGNYLLRAAGGLMADCHARLNEWDQAARAYEYMAGLSIGEQEGRDRIRAANAWLRDNQPVQAIKQAAAATRAAKPPRGAFTVLAQARIMAELIKPADQRDWSASETALDTARSVDEEPLPLTLLTAEMKIAGGDPTGAADLLKALPAAEAESPQVQATLARALRESGDDEAAAELIASMKPSVREASSLKLSMQDGDIPAAIEQLKQMLQAAPPSRRTSLAIELVRLEIEQDNLDEAEKRLNELPIDEGSPDVRLLDLRADILLRKKDWARLQPVEAELRTLEGDSSGTLWRYYRARRIFAGAATEDEMAECVALADDIQRIRPDWAKGYLLAAVIAERRDTDDEAIRRYRQAIQHGADGPGVWAALLRLMLENDRLTETDRLLEQLASRLPQHPGLSSAAVNALVKLKRVDQAVELAKSTTEQFPESGLSRLRLANVLLLTGPKAYPEVERSLRAAISLDPSLSKAWFNLVALYQRSNKIASALDVVKQLLKSGALSPVERKTMAAKMYSGLGAVVPADSLFREVFQTGEATAETHLAAAEHFSGSHPRKAEEHLRKAMELEPRDAVKRSLASVLVRCGDDAEVASAVALLGEVCEGTPDELLVAGTVAWLQRRRDRRLLARAYEIANDLASADRELRRVASLPQAPPSDVAAYLRFLLDHHMKQADVWMVKLEEVAAQALPTWELKLRWMNEDEQRVSETKAALDRFLESELNSAPPNQRVAYLEGLGRVAESIGDEQLAERLLKATVGITETSYRLYVDWLVTKNRRSEALTLVREAHEKAPNDLAHVIILTRALAAPGTEDAPEGDSGIAECEAILTKALDRNQGAPDLLAAIAAVRINQGLDSLAESLLDQALNRNGDHVGANLVKARLLIERGESSDLSEALSRLRRIMRQRGRSVSLLKLNALALLRMGSTEEALDVLREAMHSSNSAERNPTLHLYVSIARSQTGSDGPARSAFHRAGSLGLDVKTLSPSEQAMHAELEQRFSAQLP